MVFWSQFSCTSSYFSSIFVIVWISYDWRIRLYRSRYRLSDGDLSTNVITDEWKFGGQFEASIMDHVILFNYSSCWICWLCRTFKYIIQNIFKQPRTFIHFVAIRQSFHFPIEYYTWPVMQIYATLIGRVLNKT